MPVTTVRRRLAAILLLLLAVAGCTPTPPPATPPQHYAGPAEPELEAEAVWSSGKDSGLRPIALLERGVVLGGTDGSALLIDAAGEVGWRVPGRYELPGRGQVSLYGPSGSAGGAVIVARYMWVWCHHNTEACRVKGRVRGEEFGLAAFSATDGRLLWSKPLVPSTPQDPEADERPTSVRLGETVVAGSVIMSQLVPQREGHDTGMVTSVALDPRTGRELWTQDGLVVDSATGDRVAGRRVNGSWSDPSLLDGRPVVLEAVTGREVWRGTEVGWWDDVPKNQTVQAGTGYGVVRPGSPGDSQDPSFAVELAGGGTYPIRADAQLGVAADGPYQVWTEAASDRPWSAGLESGEPRLGAEPVESLWLLKAVGGYLWGMTGVKQAIVAHDRTGGRRLEPLPGKPTAIDANWLVTADHDGATVYRLTR